MHSTFVEILRLICLTATYIISVKVLKWMQCASRFLCYTSCMLFVGSLKQNGSSLFLSMTHQLMGNGDAPNMSSHYFCHPVISAESVYFTSMTIVHGCKNIPRMTSFIISCLTDWHFFFTSLNFNDYDVWVRVKEFISFREEATEAQWKNELKRSRLTC